MRAPVLVLLVALASVGIHAAGADASMPVTVSPNWSGFVVTAPVGKTVSFTSATGTWTEPTLTCASGAVASSAIWVGLGGYSGNGTEPKLEQAGVDANCDKSGKPVYYAWLEVVPYPAFTI